MDNVSHCKIIEDMRNEAAKEAAMLEKNKMVTNFLSLGTVLKADLAKASGLTLDEINEIEQQMSSVNS